MRQNNYAVIGLPIYLLVALIASTLVITIFTISISSLFQETEITHIKTEIEKIITEAENMYEYSDSGTLKTIKISLPSSLKFVVFGGFPETEELLPKDNILDEKTSNNYYFVTNDGAYNNYHSIARLCGKQTDQIAIFKQGTYNIKLELVEGNDRRSYVKIYI